MNCIIVDDEPVARKGMKSLVEQIPQLTLVGSFNNANAASAYINEYTVDLIFLDIQMPGITGIEFAQSIPVNTLIVFTTAYAEYALDSYEVSAIDYLVKPIEQEKLNEVLNRILHEEILGDEPENEIKPVENTGLKQVIQEIKENYTKDITLTELADKYQVSASHLSGLIKSELGLPFSEYLASRRIQKAKELLADETLSIDAIAEMVGYKDYFYFTKVFKKTEGISPSKYRKSIRG